MGAMKKTAVTLASLVALAACATEADKARDRSDLVERRYHVTPSDARALIGQFPELDSAPAYAAFDRIAPNLGLTRLNREDSAALSALVKLPEAKRDELVAALSGPEVGTYVTRLRAATGYEARLREADALVTAAKTPASLAEVSDPSVVLALKAVREHAPNARFPLAALAAAATFKGIEPRPLEVALDRFAALEIDVGVQELDPLALTLLSQTARSPRSLDALSVLAANLPALTPGRVAPDALEAVAAIGSSALREVAEHLGPTRAFRGLVGVDRTVANVLAIFALRPRAAMLLPILEDGAPDYSFGWERDAKALVQIEAASQDGYARSALASVLLAHPLVSNLDPAGAAFLQALVAKEELRTAVKDLNAAYPGWHAAPRELEAIAALASSSGIAPLGRSLRQLGYDPAEKGLTLSEARELAVLASDEAATVADAIHVILPRLTVRTASSLHELHLIIKAGVGKDDILRLDTDSIAGTLDPEKRDAIIKRAHASRPPG
jgi:hypothetical protein